MSHIIIKNTDNDKVEGRLCIERGVSANIIASTEEAAAALAKVAQAMDVDNVILLVFEGNPEPCKEDGWRLTNVRVYAKQVTTG